MTLHIATATVVKVSIGGAGANSVAAFIRRGDVVPEGVDSAQLERLIGQGFIAELEEVDPEPEPSVFTQADVDAAVKAAEDAKDVEHAAKIAEITAKTDDDKKTVPAAKTAPAKTV